MENKEAYELYKYIESVWKTERDAGRTDLPLYDWLKQALFDEEKESV